MTPSVKRLIEAAKKVLKEENKVELKERSYIEEMQWFNSLESLAEAIQAVEAEEDE